MSQEFQKQLETILNTALSIFQIIATFLVAFLVLLWLTLCVWTFRDIQSRTRDVVAQVFATLLVVFFNIPGVLLYILVRPKETLAQAYERSLQEEYMLQDLEEREICPTCRVKTQPDFMFCFNCRTRLRRECGNCGSLIKIKWASCPFCGTPQKSRPRDGVAERVGLGAPRPTRQRPQAQPVGSTALTVATEDEQANLAPAYPSNGHNHTHPPVQDPATAQPYADGGQNPYGYQPADDQIYNFQEELDSDHLPYQPKPGPAQPTDTYPRPDASTDQPTTGRYRSPRQRRPQPDPDQDSQ